MTNNILEFPITMSYFQENSNNLSWGYESELSDSKHLYIKRLFIPNNTNIDYSTPELFGIDPIDSVCVFAKSKDLYGFIKDKTIILHLDFDNRQDIWLDKAEFLIDNLEIRRTFESSFPNFSCSLLFSNMEEALEYKLRWG